MMLQFWVTSELWPRRLRHIRVTPDIWHHWLKRHTWQLSLIYWLYHIISYHIILYIYIYPYYGQVKASCSEIAKSLMFVVACSCEAFAACRSSAGRLQCSTWRCGSARSAAGGCGEEMSGVVRWGWIGWVLNPWCDTCIYHWIGLREKLQETMVFTSKYGAFL